MLNIRDLKIDPASLGAKKLLVVLSRHMSIRTDTARKQLPDTDILSLYRI